MDEEGDAERAAQWDLAAADAAYKAQVEAALAHQRAVEEEQRLLLEQLEVSQTTEDTHCWGSVCAPQAGGERRVLDIVRQPVCSSQLMSLTRHEKKEVLLVFTAGT